MAKTPLKFNFSKGNFLCLILMSAIGAAFTKAAEEIMRRLFNNGIKKGVESTTSDTDTVVEETE